MNNDKRNERLFEEFPPISTEMWEEKIKQDLKGADYEKKLIWNTYEGIKIKPYYRAENIRQFDYQNALPGTYPFIRGYKGTTNTWRIREEIIVNDVAKANAEALNAIAKGATAVSFKVKELAFEEEMAQLLKGINMEEIAVHFFSSHSYSILADLLIEHVKKSGFDAHKLRGSFNFDSVSYYLLHGEYYNSREDNFNEAAALIKYMKTHLPLFKVLNINGIHFFNAGATAVQELAYVLASANEYMAQMSDRGLDMDDVCGDIQLTFGIGSNYFMEIAKLRAARMLWTRIAEQYKPHNPESLKVAIHATTGTWNKSVYDPYVNLLRLTTECMSAAIGGANAITVLPFNNTYKETDEFSARIARNIQIILKEEAYLDKVIDPAAGSYYIESLTDEIAQISWNKFREIEESGGMITVMENGSVKKDIEKVAAQRNMDIAMRKTPILGTNIFPNLKETILDEYQCPKNCNDEAYLKLYRGAELFEELRFATEKFVKNGNTRPKVFLATYGNLAMRKARATFTTNFFGCSGYEITDEFVVKDTSSTMDEILLSGANLVVICSSDEEYAQQAGELAKAVKEKDPKITVIVAGFPKELVDQLKNDGVDDFIHMRVNAVETLARYNKLLGIN
ncbi:MAG: methylmalonyl-CoA mutase family protein [Bacteroidales bacterium]|jgi:methylmalonyl-CoA mutase|nr:acyl-CoA mutase large subunit family protein [Bacteroidales bacterium]MDD4214323.1 methylmalonyl-CoA mutase family protein [Bacteroidales bacterium]